MAFPSEDKPAAPGWDVFISAKNEDFAAAERIYRFLQSKGIKAFFSPESLPQMGQADYREQIDNAIETARHMVVVGSSRQNLESLWVKAEWSMFINEKRSGRKTGNLVTVVDSGLRVDNMPITLRQYEVLELEEEEALDRLLHYVGGIKPEGYPEITDDQAGTKPKPPAKAVIVGFLRKPDTTKKKKGQKRILLLLAGLLGVLGLVIGLVLGIGGLDKFGLAPTATFLKVIASLEATVEMTPTAKANTPTPGIGVTRVRERDGMTMVYVPWGFFKMGSDIKFDEQPVHYIQLDAYWIDRTEVTNAMYASCVSSGTCTDIIITSTATNDPYYGNSMFDNYPVMYVSWNQANTYCQWVGGRLPTEAEWEKAARGTDGQIYPWGNGAPNPTMANYSHQIGSTTEVGSYSAGASPYGALDMAGNVWEWVMDFYDSEYYSMSPSINPPGASSGVSHVLRGGSWSSSSDMLRTSCRSAVLDFRSKVTNSGFRCVILE